MSKKYDVGILGWWYGKNYGSILTYYGLNQAITQMGYDVLMVHEAVGYNGWRVQWPDNILSMDFARRCGYTYTQQCHYSDMPQLNTLAHTFLVGSDQLWNPHIGRVNDDLFLDFVSPENKRVAYATSFGNRDTKKFNPEFRDKHAVNLNNFQAISVRESYAVDIANTVFGVEATKVADPVFLLERQQYEALAEQATIKPSGEYLATFYLDLTPEKKAVAEALADKLGLDRIVVIPNPDKGRAVVDEVFKGSRFEILKEDAPENFLAAYKNATYVVTDSFHGTAFSAIFEKPFSSIYNVGRGVDRFANLLNDIGFGETRRVYETDTAETIRDNPNVSLQIDFTECTRRIAEERNRSRNWLMEALKMKHTPTAVSSSAEKVQDTVAKFAKQTVSAPAFHSNQSGIGIKSKRASTKLSVPSKLAAKGNWIWSDLPTELRQGARYRLEIDWNVKTARDGLNVHIMNGDTKDFKVIGSAPINGSGAARRQDVIEFVAPGIGYSQLMLGAVHFTGWRAGAEVFAYSLEEVGAGGPVVANAPKEVQTANAPRPVAAPSAPSAAPAPKAPAAPAPAAGNMKPLKELLLSNKFVFYRAGSGGDPMRQEVKFLPDGKLGNVSHQNEAAWKLDGNTLTILSAKGKPTTVFENLKPLYAADELRITGQFLPKPSVKHVLETVQTAVARANQDPDFVRVKMLVAKLRDHGIKDVVLSPGGRDVVLNRAIESHPELFKVHYLLDERSAGYFALGIANKTKRTTAVVVTSGTAASNLAPAITEAFYMNLPVLAITADRYPEYHGIGEDQTIEQANMFEPMVRKSVDLRGGMGRMSDAMVSRQISDAILSAKDGPAHINLPVNNLPHQAPVQAAYDLPAVQRVARVSALDSDEIWQTYHDKLLKSKKILLLYRQSYKPTPEELANITAFAKQYNVVIAADWLSNVSGPHVVHPFTALRKMSQREFNTTLMPDLVISVGTKNVMNHPINFKLRGAPAVPHWDVEPHGELKDLYFKLTDVLHVNKEWFFERFAALGKGHSNDGAYLSAWQAAEKAATPQTYKEYHNQFVVQQVLENIPEHSLFHIGVGSSFMLTHSVNTVPDKELEVFLNMGTNGIDGSASAFMGQVAADDSDRLKVLLIGDVSFFYDMNSLWNKTLTGNTRILLVNNSGSSLLKHYGSKASYAPHSTVAEGWVKSLGFTYLSSSNKGAFDKNLKRFFSKEDKPMFFEVFL